MATLTPAPPATARTGAPPVRLQTTLYDLIAAITAEVDPEEDEVVLATMVHLLQTSRITCTHGGTTHRLVCDAAACLYSV